MTRLELTSADNGKTIEISPDTTLGVSLDENPTTGYRWSIDPVQPLLIIAEGDEYMIHAGGGLGGAGVRQFVFRATRSGELRLSLRLVRAWDQSVAARFAVMLKVR